MVLVTRTRESPTSSFRLCPKGCGQRAQTLSFECFAALPEAELYVLAIRGEQLEAPEVFPLLDQLGKARAPVLVLSPVLPKGAARLKALLPRAILTLPVVAAHWHAEEGRLDNWCSRFAPTQIGPSDETPGSAQTIVQLLNRGGLPAKTTNDVARRGVATTVAFFPLQVAVVAGGPLRGWVANPELLRILRRALRETARLGRRLGPIERGVRWLVFLAGFPPLLRVGCFLAPRFMPSLVRFLEHHFGPKLLAQHRLFTAQIAELGRAEGCPTPHLERLLALADRNMAQD